MFYPVQQNGQWDKAKCILGQTFVSKVNYTLLVFKESHNKLLSYFYFSLWANVWAQIDGPDGPDSPDRPVAVN